MRRLYILIMVSFLLASCDKNILEVAEPELAILNEEEITISSGESVVFRLRGKADLLSFYSGEVYSDYQFREGRKVNTQNAEASLSFRTAVELGNQRNQLTVLLSKNFSGNYTSIEQLNQATWIDITSRFTLATNSTFTNSGTVSIADLVGGSEPFYLAYRYKTLPQNINGSGQRWLIENIAISSSEQINGQNLSHYNLYEAGFRLIDQFPINAPSLALITPTRLTMRANNFISTSSPDYDPANPFADPETEHWFVSTRMITNEIDLGPDYAIPIKGVNNSFPAEFAHQYNRPGTYEAYFVATNNSIKGRREKIEKVTVKVN